MNNEERILSLIENGFHLNKPDLDYIRQLSLKAKAFDVIKEKRVDTYSLEFCDKLVQYNMYVKVYNESVWKGNERHFLEEEEFNLIKQALEVE